MLKVRLKSVFVKFFIHPIFNVQLCLGRLFSLSVFSGAGYERYSMISIFASLLSFCLFFLYFFCFLLLTYWSFYRLYGT